MITFVSAENTKFKRFNVLTDINVLRVSSVYRLFVKQTLI